MDHRSRTSRGAIAAPLAILVAVVLASTAHGAATSCDPLALGAVHSGESVSGELHCTGATGYQVVRQQAHGFASVDAGGIVTYDSTRGATGPDSFTVQVSGTPDVQPTVTVQVTDDAPACDDLDLGTTTAGSSAVGSANCVDADGDLVTDYAIATQPAHGSADVSGGGVISYTPNHGYKGPDSFTFTGGDGIAASAPATASVVVVNHPPAASVGGPLQAFRNQAITLTANDHDPDGTIAGRAWTLDGDPVGTGAKTLTLTFNGIGPHVVTLDVTDDDGAPADTAYRTIMVVDRPPSASITGPATGSLGVPVALTGTATDLDGADTLADLAWDTDGDGQFDDATGTTAAPVYSTPGARTIRFQVTDDDGKIATAAKTVTIAGPSTVAPAFDTTPPHLTLAAAGGRTLARALAKGLKLTLTSSEPATVRIRLTVPKRMARKLGLGRKATVVGKLTRSIGAGQTPVTIRFTARARKKLKRAKQLKLAVAATATDAAGNAANVPKSLSLKR
jgi:Bacterial Ig domain/PKD domain